MLKPDQKASEKLFRAIASIDNAEDCKSFFEDLCTIQEICEMAQRFEVACLLEKGESYASINKITKASTATICRVGKCVKYGGGGYRKGIENLKEEKSNV